MDAHVTVKGTFVGPTDLVAIAERIAECVEGYPPFTVRTTEPEVIERGGFATVVLPLEESKALVVLHDRLVKALAPYAAEHIYPGDRPAAYRPHVTLVQQILLEGVEQTLRAIAGWRVNYFWTVRDIDLVGREDGKLWRSLRRFDFGRPL